MSALKTGVDAQELVPLSDRLRYMVLFRVVAVLGVAIAVLRVPDFVTVEALPFWASTAGYLAVSLAGYGLWRLAHTRGILLFGALLIIDGAYLAWLSYATGGSASVLRLLVLFHVVVVALLASYRTGLKLAMWHSLLLWAGYQLQESGVLATPEAALALPGGEIDRLVLFAVMIWALTFVTTSFSAVNERELRRRRVDLEALARMTTGLESAKDALGVADVLLTSVTDNFMFERGVVLAGEGETLSVLATQGDIDAGSAGVDVPEDSVVRGVMESRRTALISDARRDTWLAALLPSPGDLVLLPLSAEGRPVGVLVVEHRLRTGSRIERRVVGMVERFASQGALALRNAWLVEQLRKTADTDGLTGIANRRTFDRSLERELSRAARAGEDVTLMMADIDNFKRLNDTYGHQVGDDVIRRVAQTLATDVRTYDLPARYGGEEFAVILPRTSPADAPAVCERLRRAVGEQSGEPPATLSAGIATFPADGTDPAELIARADEALYEAKRGGRDQLAVARSRDEVPAAPAGEH